MKENTISFKENLNNKSNKLNLPSIWTSKKIKSLLFLTLLSAYQVNSGEQFKKCLKGYSTNIYNDRMYDTIKSFANGISDKQWFCCNSGFRGSGPLTCSNMTALQCPYIGLGYDLGQCNKLGRSRICIMGTDTGGQNLFPAGLCGGILGDVPSSNDVVGTCPNLEVVRSALSGSTTAPGFSWLCCDKDNCVVPINVDLKIGWDYIEAHTNCPVNQYNLMCFEDNKGWSCAGNQSSILENVFHPMDSSCILQLADEDTVTTSMPFSTLTSISTNTFSPTLSPQPENGNGDGLSNSDKIALGTSIPSVFLTAFGSWIAWKEYKKKKEKAKNARNETELNTLGEGTSQAIREAVPNNQIMQPQYQAQIENNPYYNNYYYGQGWRNN